MRWYVRVVLLLIVLQVTGLSQTSNSTDSLVRVLEAKGILTAADVKAITTSGSPTEQRDRLAALLRDKGVISASEFDSIRTATGPSEVKTITPASITCAGVMSLRRSARGRSR